MFFSKRMKILYLKGKKSNKQLGKRKLKPRNSEGIIKENVPSTANALTNPHMHAHDDVEEGKRKREKRELKLKRKQRTFA